MKTRKTNRLLALCISLCMVVGMLPMTGMTLAAEAQTCSNHAAHDDSCGFAQAVEGRECGHTHDENCGYAEGMGNAPCKHEQGEHDESCGYTPPSEETPCGHTHDESCGEPDENGEYLDCAHRHDGGCGYAPASEGTPCAHQEHDGECGYGEGEEGAPCLHTHDADCGYVQEVEGNPCNHVHDETCSNPPDQDSGPETEEPVELVSFAPLAEEVAKRSFAAGELASVEALALPETLTGHDGEGAAHEVPVKWACPDFAPETPGSYVFTAELGAGFFTAAQLPQITVEIAGAALLSAGQGTFISLTFHSNIEYNSGKSYGSATVDAGPIKLLQNGQVIQVFTGPQFMCIFDSVTDGSYTIQIEPGTYQFAGSFEFGDGTVEDIRGYKQFHGLSVDFVVENGAITSAGPESSLLDFLPDSLMLLLWAVGNKEFNAGGVNYRITKENNPGGVSGNEASVAAIWNYPNSQVIVPRTVTHEGTTYKVTGMDEGAFSHKSSIQEVYITNNVEAIGVRAFYSCENLKTVTLPPDSLKTIGDSAFNGCGFTSITLPNSLTGIGSSAFSLCASLTSIDLPDSLTTLKVSTFDGCTSLASARFPKNLTSIDNFAFDGCRNLNRLVFTGSTPPAIEWSAFRGVADKGIVFCPAETQEQYEAVLSYLPSGWKIGEDGAYSISGKVTAGGRPCSGMAVSLSGSGIKTGTLTDADGVYRFESILPGNYTVEVPATVMNGIAYYTASKPVTVESGAVSNADIALQSDTTLVKLLSVTADGETNKTASTKVTVTFDTPIAWDLDVLRDDPAQYFDLRTNNNISIGTALISDYLAGDRKSISFTLDNVPPMEVFSALYVALPDGYRASGASFKLFQIHTSADPNLRPEPMNPMPTIQVPMGGSATFRVGEVATDPERDLMEFYSVITQPDPGIATYEILLDETAALPSGNPPRAKCRLTGIALGTTNISLQLRDVAGNGANITVPIEVVDPTRHPTPKACYYGWQELLSGVKTGMLFSVDSGAKWWTCGASLFHLSNVDTTHGIWVQAPASGGLEASEIQKITLTKAEPPAGVGKTDETVGGRNDGTLTGVSRQMEFKGPGDAKWKLSGGETITGLAPGQYQVRTYGGWNMLSSDPVTLTIQAGPTPPSAPGSPQVEPGPGKAKLTWSAPETAGGKPVTGYRVRLDEGPWIDAGDASALSHTFTGLQNGASYTFQVQAVNEIGQGATATLLYTLPVTHPGPPEFMSKSVSGRQCNVAWSAPENNGGAEITGYQAGLLEYPYHLEDIQWEDVEMNTAHTFGDLEAGVYYHYYIRARNSEGWGELFKDSFQMGHFAPSAPRNVKATPGDRSVTLTWEPPADPGSGPITSYGVKIDNQRDYTDCKSTDRSYTFQNLQNGQSYEFLVKAWNSTGGSAAVRVTATPVEKPQALSFEHTVVSKIYGDAPFTLTANATANGGAITYSSSYEAVATVDPSSGEVTMLKAGTAVITATAAAVPGSFDETMTSYTLYVEPKPLTGSMLQPIPAQPYTGAQIMPDVTVTDGDTVLTKDVDYTVTYGENLSVGKGTVTVTGKDNYTDQLLAGFTIGKAQPSPSWPSALTAEYGTLLSDIPLTNPSDGEFRWDNPYDTVGSVGMQPHPMTFYPTNSANYAPVAGSASVNVTEKSITGAAVTVQGSYTYTGQEIEPTDVTVVLEGRTLRPDTDYNITEYSANLNAGQDTGIVTVTGKGNYTGSTTGSFTIGKKTPTLADLSYTIPTGQVYDGQPHGVTVNKANQDIGTITVLYNQRETKPTDAGTYAVTVDILETSNYGAAFNLPLGDFIIAKAPAPKIIWPAATSITYGQKLSESKLFGGSTAQGSFAWKQGDLLLPVGVSQQTVVFTPGETAQTNYESLAETEKLLPVTVTKAITFGVDQTFEVKSGSAQDYSFDLTTLLPDVSPGQLGAVTYSPAITANGGGLLGSLSYTTGPTLTLPVQSAAADTTATVTVTVSSENYADFTADITVKATDKTPITISGVTMTGGEYSGKPYGYTGTPVIKDNATQEAVTSLTLDALYESTDGGGYSRAQAPTNAGAYRLTLSAPADNADYSGSAAFTFTITHKPVTAKAADQRVKQGAKLPAPTVTYDGFVSPDSPGNTLSRQAAAQYEVRDSKTVGSSEIGFATRAALNNLGGLNYTLTHETGILTVYPGSNACEVVRVNSPAGADLSGSKITKTVSYGTSPMLIDVTVSDFAAWALYSDSACTQEIPDRTMPLTLGENNAYLKVVAEDGLTSRTYAVIITVEKPKNELTNLSGITPGGSIEAGGWVEVTAVGDGMDNGRPLSGATRWLPWHWRVNPEGYFPENGPYVARFNTADMAPGPHILTITFKEQMWNGASWDDTGNYDTQSIPFTLTPGSNPDPTPGGSGGSGGGSGSGSGGGSGARDGEYDFWQSVRNKIANADAGTIIKVNARGYDRMPWHVMEALRKHPEITMEITWKGGGKIVIPAGTALPEESGRIFYPLSYLEKRYENAQFPVPPAAVPGTDTDKMNPETGGVIELTAPETAAQFPVTPADRGTAEAEEAAQQGQSPEAVVPERIPAESAPEEETLPTGESQPGQKAAGGGIPVAAVLVLVLLAGAGVWLLWKRNTMHSS